MSNQYEVLGAAPKAGDLKKLSPNDVHLTIENLYAGYGKMEILHNLDLFVSRAQSLCLIGPNGAGKSTILHSIYGFTNIFSGKIKIDGREITKLTPAEKLKSEGIAYILQDNSVFPDMTVEENLLMGGFIKDKTEESFEEAEKVLQKYLKESFKEYGRWFEDEYNEKLVSVRYNHPFDAYPDLYGVLESGKNIPIEVFCSPNIDFNLLPVPVCLESICAFSIISLSIFFASLVENFFIE